MNGYPTRRFGEVFSIQLGKMLDKRKNRGELFPYVANRDVQWGRCDVSNLRQMRFTSEDRQRFDLRPGDLLVCEGGEVGRTAIWHGEVADCYFQKAIHRLRPRVAVEPRFVLHYMQWAAERGAFARLTSSTSIAHLTKAKLAQATLPLPPVNEQRRIAAILDQADAIRRKRREAVQLTDELLRSVFLEMFGDPVRNPMGWRSAPLDAVAAVDSGVTKNRRLVGEDTVEVPYMRVANVQDGYLDLGEVKTIPVARARVDRFLLREGDVLLTEGGDPDKLGRGAVWHGELPQCVHQNHVFRVRVDPAVLVPEFASALIGSQRGKRYFLRASKQTTGIASINKTQLRRFSMLVPPLKTQRRYLLQRVAVDRAARRSDAAIANADSLFRSLVQRAFRGEL